MVFLSFLFFWSDRPTQPFEVEGDGKRNILLGWPKLIYQRNRIWENLRWIGGKAARMSLATFRLGRTGAHTLGFLKILKNIEQPTRYSIKTNLINPIKKSSLFKNDKANIKVGRAYFYPHPQIHTFWQIQWRSEKWSTQNLFKNNSTHIN